MKNVQIKSFLGSIVVLAILMVFSYILTFIIPSGEYLRALDSNGNLVIVGEYSEVTNVFPFYKFILAPFLVLGSNDGSTTILLICFLLIIGGIFEVLNKQQLVEYAINVVNDKFKNKKYLLLSICILIFMLMGSFIGTAEEIVPIVPICILLTLSLGFDQFVGMGISTMSACAGFSAGIMNPFTVGTAQRLAGLPMFSGAWFRVLSFIVLYILLNIFLLGYARKHEKQSGVVLESVSRNKQYDKAILIFVLSILSAVILIILGIFIPLLSDIALVIVILAFLVGGSISAFVSGISIKKYLKTFISGMINVAPAILMILMAISIKYILVESKTLDTVLYYLVNVTKNTPKYLVILVIYLIALVVNFFIPSGSAEAFLLIPLIIPLADALGISYQLCIVAYAFGDGLSNIMYPTNPLLLITLNINKISYKDYIKFSYKYHIATLLITSLLLVFGYFVGY